MYIANEKTEKYNRIDQLFSDKNLYMCKQDIECQSGKFTAGTLVRLDLQGCHYEDNTEKWHSLHGLRICNSASELFSKSNKTRIEIMEIDLDMLKFHHSESSTKDYFELSEVTCDTFESVICKYFERQASLEAEVDDAEQEEESAKGKRDKYINASIILGIIVGGIILIECVMLVTSEKTSLFNVLSIAITIITGVVLLFVLNLIGDNIWEKAQNKELESVETAYKKWKVEKSF